ncbi:MAG: hypothetical protein ABIJ08_02230 [Nanoarchaeota archaeon]
MEKDELDKEQPEESNKDSNKGDDMAPANKKEDTEESDAEEDTKKKKSVSEKFLLVTAVLIIIIFAAIFISRIILQPGEPKTIDDLHKLNLDGKLTPDKGYVYNGYSFVNIDNFWYTSIMSPKGTTEFSLMFRFGPEDVQDIQINGKLNTDIFDKSKLYYVTFNPLGKEFSYVALAVNDFNQNMMKAYNKVPIAACDKNETAECSSRPIITCDNTDELVFYVNESDQTSIDFKENCIVINGQKENLIKGVDRLLFLFYGIM